MEPHQEGCLFSGTEEEARLIFAYVGQVAPDGLSKIPVSMQIPDLLNSAPNLEPLSMSHQFRVVSALASEALVISDSKLRGVFMTRRRNAEYYNQAGGFNMRGVRRQSMTGPLRMILGEGKPAVEFFLTTTPHDIGVFYKLHCKSQTWVSLPTTTTKADRNMKGPKRARLVPQIIPLGTTFISHWFCRITM